MRQQDSRMGAQAFVAVVTCFDAREEVDYQAVRRQVRRQVEAGNNILCAGTNGDFTALTFAEKVQLCAEVADEIDGHVRLFVNAGMPATYETKQLAREFDRIGVDGISVVTPYFIACTQQSLLRHFSEVADAVNTPVYLYDIPARTQNRIEPETAALLARHGNIAGIKDSGGEQASLDAFLEIARANEAFDVYSGPDHLIHYALRKGAAGCISGLGNVAPALLAGLCAAFNRGDEAQAAALQERFAALRLDLYALGYPPALVKRALFLMDPSVGLSRRPAYEPTAEADVQIGRILTAHGLL